MSSGAFAALAGKDNHAAPKIVRTIQKAVMKSYEADRFRGTDKETRRRIEICLDGFRKMRGDFDWTIDRCLDELPTYLRHKLDGTPWTPKPERAIWTPGVGDPLLRLT